MNDRWIQVTPSEFPWEQTALRFVKERLPDHEPYRAWANFEFIEGGAIGEVDLFVVSPKGLFLVEIKSWPGTIRGDQGTWWKTKPGETREDPLDNPVIGTNRKAKRLKSLLGRQPAFRGERVPFIQPLVFLSNEDLDCKLGADAREHVAGLGKDDHGNVQQAGGLPSVVDILAKYAPGEHEALGKRRIDKPTAKRVATAFEQAGIRPSQRSRRVADLDLDSEPIDEGAGYQDFSATHPRAAHAHRRVRIYGTPDQEPLQREIITRAAQREFELLSAVDHAGILKALDIHEHELGPAIVFERDPSEIRLDQFLQERGQELDLGARIDLIRDIAEPLAYAHGRRLAHRALSPRSILVTEPAPGKRRYRVFNWQTGSRDSETGSFAATIRGTQHVGDLIDDDTSPYLAPESLTVPDADPQLLDVFSLGAIAYHVLTGQRPASTLSALVERLERDGALEVSAALDGAGDAIGTLVRDATAADATNRIQSVNDFLIYLDAAEDELTAPDEHPAPEEVDPRGAKQGDAVAGFTVEKRLGRGSTAIALLVKDDRDQQRVLKIANDPDRNLRIVDEAETLAQLRDRTIIASHGNPIEVAGLKGIVLTYAQEGTLAQHLHRDGRLSLGALERLGTDLLAAMSYLEREGVTHRDIKPDNLGITEVGPRKERHLVLMDFSLAGAPADQLTVGTRPYLDPFLGSKFGRTRWDLHGDRFAAAVVLHEMAAGSLPHWGSRATDPRFTDAEVTVDRDAFPREVAEPLAELLERALARNVNDRFDTADDLARAFARIFDGLADKPEDAVASKRAAELRAVATITTPVTALGLSARATDFLERRNVQTVTDLIALPNLAINTAYGLGLDTRRELTTALRELRTRLTETNYATVATTTATTVQDNRSLATLAALLLPTETSRNRSTSDALKLLLGLTPIADGPAWPSQTEVSTALDLTRARVGQVTAKARSEWLAVPGLDTVRDELVARIDSLGTIATPADLEPALIADRGTNDPTTDQPLARAVTRAAVEIELAVPDPRIAQRRTHDGRVILATGSGGDSRQKALDYAIRLGVVADEIADAGTLVAPAEVTDRLRRQGPPTGMPLLPADRLVALAAATSTNAAVSARLELHPRDMPPERALTLGRAGLLGGDRITPEEIARRIAARFPNAQPLPERPQLDQLLQDAGLDIHWDETENAYLAVQRVPVTGLTSLASSIGRQKTATGSAQPRPASDPDVVAAQDFERRLTASKRDGGMLSLMAYPQELPDASKELRRLDVSRIDLDALLIDALHRAASEMQITDWEVVLSADAADRSSTDWTNLNRLVARAMPAVEQRIAGTPGTVLLEHVGLLARYGQLGLFDRLREKIMAGSPLRACWTLLPADEQADRPAVDGDAVPVLTPNEYTRIPMPWLRNLHRAAA